MCLVNKNHLDTSDVFQIESGFPQGRYIYQRLYFLLRILCKGSLLTQATHQATRGHYVLWIESNIRCLCMQLNAATI